MNSPIALFRVLSQLQPAHIPDPNACQPPAPPRLYSPRNPPPSSRTATPEQPGRYDLAVLLRLPDPDVVEYIAFGVFVTALGSVWAVVSAGLITLSALS